MPHNPKSPRNSVTKPMVPFTVLLLLLSILGVGYSVALLVDSPGMGYHNIISFSNIWAVGGLCCLALAVYRIRTGSSFFGTRPKLRKVFIVLCAVGIVFSAAQLVVILNPALTSPFEAHGMDEYVRAPTANDSSGTLRQAQGTDLENGAAYLVLLGGGIRRNGTLGSSVLSRVEGAARYLKAHPKTLCVVTGGTLHDLPYPEAPALKAALVERGIAENRILLEDQALDTIQNFTRSLPLIAAALGIGEEDVLATPGVVVTNRSHLARALFLAHRLGFTNVIGIETPTPLFHVPTAYLREICAWLKLYARLLLTGKPRAAYE